MDKNNTLRGIVVLKNIIYKINNFGKIYELPIITALITLCLINLFLAISIILALASNKSTGKVKSANTPVVKILAPSAGESISGEFPVRLTYSGAGSNLAKLTVLVGGVLEKEFNNLTDGEIDFTIDSGKFSNGQHPLIFKVSDQNGTTQTFQLDVKFTKEGKRGKTSI